MRLPAQYRNTIDQLYGRTLILQTELRRLRMTPIESLELARQRLLEMQPHSPAGKRARDASVRELEEFIAAMKLETLETLRAEQRAAGVEPIQ